MQIQMFAAAKDLAGSDAIEVDFCFPIEAWAIKEAIVAQCPNLKPLVEHSRIAVDGRYMADDAQVHAATEIALIPPVSGG